MSRHDPVITLRHMLEYAREAAALVRGRARADLDRDRQLNLGVVRLLEVLGEAATRIPLDVRARYPQIQWTQIVGMRNRLVHAYDFIDFNTIWKTLTVDLQPLIAQLESILANDKAPD
jgi:uncharacterized protein with HEPN domain